MDRMACVDVPALPLQLLMRRQPEWAEQPAAVVDRDRPQGVVEWVNEPALRAGVLPGMSYAAGLSLAGGLRAAEVPPGDVAAGVDAIAGLLRRFTPGVEPSRARPGVFWLDASGLQPLFASLVDWARGVRVQLRAAGFRAWVVVGFTRFGTYALARAGGEADGRRPDSRVTVLDDAEHARARAGGEAARRGPDGCVVGATRGPGPPVVAFGSAGRPTNPATSLHRSTAQTPGAGEAVEADRRRADGGVAVLEDAAAERRAARRVPLRRLDVDPALRDALDKLGVRTVGAFLRLPAAGVRRRFGREAHRLHREAAGDLVVPFQPAPAVEPLARRLDLDEPETGVEGLLFRVKQALDPLLGLMASRQEALAGLELRLRLDAPAAAPRVERVETIRPAAPTLDVRQVLNLVRLRVEGLARQSSPDGAAWRPTNPLGVRTVPRHRLSALSAGVIEIGLAVTPARATREQLRLFQEGARRDLRAADRAVARVRAEFGDGAVVRAALADGHLPEAAFAWRPLDHVVRPVPAPAGVLSLVRRLFAAPRRVPSRRRRELDGRVSGGAGRDSAPAAADRDAPGLPATAATGRAAGMRGPYVVSGGWWRTPVHREYYFASAGGRTWRWIYYDRRRRAWFEQGAVE